MTFLAPILLSGLALAAVPFIIHLLNRRRFRVVEWAPMKYLKLTIKSNRRRLQIEQWLLLALRTLLVAAIILAIARPTLSEGGLGGAIGGKGRVSRILVVDDSLSMGYLVEHQSAFELAKRAVADLLAGVGPQDGVTALVTSDPAKPIVRDAHLDAPATVTDPLGRLSPTDVRSDWAATFKAVDELLTAATFPTRDVTVVTDLRRAGWGPGVTDMANKWAAAGVTLKVVDVGSRSTENASVAALSRDDPVALPSAPANLHAEVRNRQPTAMAGAQATFEVGGASRPLALPDVPPGQVATVPLTFTPPAAGHHVLKLSLPPDGLPADDARWLALAVKPTIAVALVDGEPSAKPFEGETDFLSLAFTVGSPPWDVRRLTDAEWAAARPGDPRLADADVTVLANVAALSPDRVAALERMVAAGMGLIVFPGEQVDAQLYNDRLYRGGAGLLPARLGPIVDGPVTGMVVEPADGSPLAPLSKVASAALSRVVAKRYATLDVPPPAGAAQPTGGVAPTTREAAADAWAKGATRVLARWNDAEARPAAVERRFGRGRVVLWSLTADKQWSDWPVEPTYVLAMRSAAAAVARPDGGDRDPVAGQTARVELPEGADAVDPRVTPPGGQPEPAAVEKHAGGPTTLSYAKTAKAGIYAFAWKDAAGKEQVRPVAVNPDPAESDLDPIPEAELTALMGDLRPPVVRYVAGRGLASGPGREVWRTIVWAVLAMAVVETMFAVWVGRER